MLAICLFSVSAQEGCLCRHGIPQKNRLTEWYTDLPEKKDRTATQHQMGKVHARHCFQISSEPNRLSSPHHQNTWQRAEAIWQCTSFSKFPFEKAFKNAKALTTIDNVCSTALLGKYSKSAKCTTVHHQRGNGPRIGSNNTNLPCFIGNIRSR